MAADQNGEEQEEPAAPAPAARRRRKFHEQLKRICSHERTSEGGVVYLIETQGGQYEKVSSKFLLDHNPVEMAKYLESFVVASLLGDE